MAVSTNVYVIAAMCGNFWTESGINPGIYESLRVVPLTDNSVYGGYGIGQWTNAPKLGVTRRTQLINWLRANGYADDSGPGQLSYLVYENTWYRNGYGARFNSLSDFFASDSTDLTILTYAYMQGWEGIWNGTQNQRVQQANQCLQYIQQHAEEDPGEWIVGNRYLNTNERLHNALIVYNWMSGNQPLPPDPTPVPPDPDPPTPPDPSELPNPMPLWMWIRYH